MNGTTEQAGVASIRYGLAEALARLPAPGGKRFAGVLADAHVEVEIYAPRGIDPQKPHRRDELYVVATGSGLFRCGGEEPASPATGGGRQAGAYGRAERFGPGDLLFAAAGEVHRFEEFTDDLAVWVIFYGPEK